MNNSDNFVIKNGVLKKYKGKETEIVIPDGVTEIGEEAFFDCKKIESITLSDSVKSIGRNAFAHCSSLESITIPDSVTSIGKWAFGGCSSLKSITIPDSVTSIGEIIFGGKIYFKGQSAGRIPAWCSFNSVISGFIMNYEKKAASESESKYYADYFRAHRCEIDFKYFAENKELLIFVSEHDVFTGEEAEIILNMLPENEKTEERALLIEYMNTHDYGSDLLDLDYVPLAEIIKEWRFRYETDKTVTITKYVGDKAEVSCPVKIGYKTVTGIGDYAFRDCRRLTSITLHDSITSIGSGAFAGCRSLTSITIPDGVKEIGKETFSGCRRLKSVVIPESVTDIGEDAFEMCYALPAEMRQKIRVIQTGNRGGLIERLSDIIIDKLKK